MNVLYFADTRFPIERANGVQTMATCHALAARGHEVTLVVRPDSATAARDPFVFYGRPPIDRLRLRRVPAWPDARASRARFLATALVLAARQRSAVVYTRDLGLASFLLRLSSRRRPQLVYESHGIAPVVSQEMARLLGKPDLTNDAAKITRLDRRERRVWHEAPAYVTLTRALAEDLSARYGGRQDVFVVPDGADEPRDAPTPPAGASTVGYAGHLYPWKGVDVFVRALALLPGVRGLIVGGHPGEADVQRVRALVDDLQIQDRVHITGLVPADQVAAHLAPASVLVLPNVPSAISDRYTSPLKLFEYLWLARPIVASDLAAVREVLTDGATALLVPPGEPAPLAQAIARVLADPALAATLGAAARRLAPGFTWAARAARVEAALRVAAGA